MVSLDDGKTEMVVITDVTMGGSSMHDGSLEALSPLQSKSFELQLQLYNSIICNIIIFLSCRVHDFTTMKNKSLLYNNDAHNALCNKSYCITNFSDCNDILSQYEYTTLYDNDIFYAKL